MSNPDRSQKPQFSPERPLVQLVTSNGKRNRIMQLSCKLFLCLLGLSSSLAAQTLSPTSIPFGNQAVGTVSVAKNVTLSNKKKTAITITDITTSLLDYMETNTCPSTLPAGSSCTIAVSFEPAAAGARHAGLTVSDSSGTQTVSLNGNGLLAVVATPSSLAFGNEVVGKKSAAKVVTVKNNQTTSLAINSITTDLSDYSVATDTCPISPATLAAGATCKISVVFTPTVSGARNGTLTIADTASNSLTVALTGIGVPPVTTTPGSLSFGSQAIGTTSSPQSVTLTNNQSSLLKITSITSSSSDFAITSTCPTSPQTLAAAASCTAVVTFAPKATGVRPGTLSFKDSANNSPQTVTLSGTGAPPTLVSIAVSPASASIPWGNTQQFGAVGTYSDGSMQDLTGSVTWSSTIAAVAGVASSGLATSTGTGTTAITATSGSITGSATLVVTAPALVSIAVTPANPSFALGTTQQLTATGTYTDGSTLDVTKSVKWNTGDPSIATVNNHGLATSVAVGSTSISAVSAAITGSTTLSVSPATLVSIAVTPAIPTIPLGTTQQFAATGTFTDGSTQDVTNTVEWISDSPAVATISNVPSSQGLATGAGTGSATIRATSGSVSGSTTLTVTAAALVSIAVTPEIPQLLWVLRNNLRPLAHSPTTAHRT
jgi:Bacterial Ig-like domain (group 2)/Abnormal spindle-like microcephaly-assoc'd, ASPM-SPD-2-Hydin